MAETSRTTDFLRGWFPRLAADYAIFRSTSHGARGEVVASVAGRLRKTENSIWRAFGAARYMEEKGYPLDLFDRSPAVAAIEFVSRIGKIDPVREAALLAQMQWSDQLTVAEARGHYESVLARAAAGRDTVAVLPTLGFDRLVGVIRDRDGDLGDGPLPDDGATAKQPDRTLDPLRPVTIVEEKDFSGDGHPSRSTAVFVVQQGHVALRERSFEQALLAAVLAAHLRFEQVLVVSAVPIAMLEAALDDVRFEMRRQIVLQYARVVIDDLPASRCSIERRRPAGRDAVSDR